MNKINYYHTQESREKLLTSPIPCIRDDAWLGNAIYFWYDIDDAEDWGNSSKRRTNYYEIYQSEIDTENVLNSVFNEEHYFFWFKQIEKVAKAIISKKLFQIYNFANLMAINLIIESFIKSSEVDVHLS